MTLDPSIPLRAAQAAQVNLADLFQQQQQRQMQQQAMQQRDREMSLRQRQFDLDERRHLDALDENQREAAREGLKDIAAAVQWADTPEKWAQVQQHYAQFDPQLGTVPFQSREQVLISTGQMAEYLENTAPKIQAIEPGGSLFSISPDGRNINELVRANPGTAAPLAPVDEDRKTVGGRNFVKRGGQWFEETGGSNAAGTFQP
jgi:hypothetical protein